MAWRSSRNLVDAKRKEFQFVPRGTKNEVLHTIFVSPKKSPTTPMAAAELDLVAPFEDLNIDARPWYNDYQNKLPSEERKWHGFHCEGEGDPTERFNAHCVGPPLNNEEVQQMYC